MMVAMDDEMDYDDDDMPDFVPPTPEQLEHAGAKVEELRAAALKLGLYQVEYQLGVAPQPDGSTAMMVIANFAPGDVAWSDRILRPEVHSMDDDFRDIERGMDEVAFEEYRRKLLEGGSDDD